jgi:hypothetical protein
MNYVLQLLFWCPKCWRAIGYWMFTFSGLMLLLGWRLSKKADRIENRTAVVIDLDKVLADLLLPIPVSPEGFALFVVGAFAGLALAVAGKLAQRF